MLSSTEKLAQALEEKQDPKLAEMIQRAREGYYDDYKSSLPCPSLQLIEDLEEAGYFDISLRAIQGEFDATDEEADEWAKSEEGQQVLKLWTHPHPFSKPPEASA